MGFSSRADSVCVEFSVDAPIFVDFCLGCCIFVHFLRDSSIFCTLFFRFSRVCLCQLKIFFFGHQYHFSAKFHVDKMVFSPGKADFISKLTDVGLLFKVLRRVVLPTFLSVINVRGVLYRFNFFR